MRAPEPIDALTTDGRGRVLTDGTVMPLLGLGVWQLPDGPACVQAVQAALEIGYRHIDTAQAYGNEASVGRALRESSIAREEVFITTKFHPGRRDPLREAAHSIERLGLDYVDLYLVHWPAGGATWAWPGMEAAHARSYARAIAGGATHLKRLREHCHERESSAEPGTVQAGRQPTPVVADNDANVAADAVSDQPEGAGRSVAIAVDDRVGAGLADCEHDVSDDLLCDGQVPQPPAHRGARRADCFGDRGVRRIDRFLAVALRRVGAMFVGDDPAPFLPSSGNERAQERRRKTNIRRAARDPSPFPIQRTRSRHAYRQAS